MLVEKSRTTTVNGVVNRDGCVYEVNYSVEEGKLCRLFANVQRVKTDDQGKEVKEYVGYVVSEQGRKTVSVLDTDEAAVHAGVLDELLVEAKAEVAKGIAEK